MLDIFGFEIFKKNGFEQLCINCANEKLQQMFNKHTFMLEEATYESEGIEFRHVDFKDSQPMLDFLGLPASGKSRDGVFVLLDDETLRGSTEDKKFLRKLISKHGDKTKLFSDRTKKKTVRIIRTTHSLLLHGPPHQLRSGCCGLHNLWMLLSHDCKPLSLSSLHLVTSSSCPSNDHVFFLPSA